MKTNILQIIVKRIKSGKFNFDNVMKKQSYYGVECNVMPLYCSYGMIGYKIFIGEYIIEFDFEINKINVYAN